ncbi:hypothetical protein FOVG_19823 [Fusarium oxysporum f. sp. pisi HDV247]|uniref:Uncharacterized protein n=1 Tax=Fusarium oxysporum f. sp. pisi HDV247 TaxID=1080344 RepID=W9NF28_FUSOX|nr:hypothetical protein FOVG_19823 [Fusarium oxysporum f. sp. pisi HDV247]
MDVGAPDESRNRRRHVGERIFRKPRQETEDSPKVCEEETKSIGRYAWHWMWQEERTASNCPLRPHSKVGVGTSTR